MAEIRLRDYESADAEDLNRITVAAFDQFRDHYDDWPAMLAGLSKTSDLSASGEVIIAELQIRLDNSLAPSPISGRTVKKPRSSINAGPSFACWSSTPHFAEKELGEP